MLPEPPASFIADVKSLKISCRDGDLDEVKRLRNKLCGVLSLDEVYRYRLSQNDTRKCFSLSVSHFHVFKWLVNNPKDAWSHQFWRVSYARMAMYAATVEDSVVCLEWLSKQQYAIDTFEDAWEMKRLIRFASATSETAKWLKKHYIKNDEK